jgi:hypothetical protein
MSLCKNRLLTFFLVFLSLLGIVIAVPTGPNSVTNLGSSRYSSPAAANVSAVAGNVTELNFIANTITDVWQGYFGNVTGAIVLGNSNNQSMYNWSLTSPSGQIYATRNSSVPTWASIRCANATEVISEDTTLGVNITTETDAVNRTFFNTTSFNQFYVSGKNINTTQNCYAVQLYNSSGISSTNFAEVLLSDNVGSRMIYTGLITNPAIGFDNRSHQFEMIVGENGHNGDTAITPYYFYLELY